jgi:hypothetical protein
MKTDVMNSKFDGLLFLRTQLITFQINKLKLYINWDLNNVHLTKETTNKMSFTINLKSFEAGHVSAAATL